MKPLTEAALECGKSPTTAPDPQYSPASTGPYDWMSDKPYVYCLKLFATGNFMVPANSSQAQQAALHEKGRHYCNRTY